MDPVTAVQVVAVAFEFTGLAVKLTKRIYCFASDSASLPDAIKEITKRLSLLQTCLDLIPSRLRRDDPEEEANLRSELYKYIGEMKAKCDKFDALLDQYLPKTDDSPAVVLRKALLSLNQDAKLHDIAHSLNENIPLLSFSVSLIGASTSAHPASSQAEHPPGQPLDSSVLDNVPLRHVENFVAREDVIVEIQKHFSEGPPEKTRVVILQAMGGQGKTQLALEYCHQSKSLVRYSGIFWVDSCDRTTVAKSFGLMAEELNPTQAFLDVDVRVRFAKSALKAWKKPWLLVFDNYDDPGKFDISDYIPNSQYGHCLITSRNPRLASIGRIQVVPGMREGQAIELLLSNYLPANGIDEGSVEASAREIVERLGYLPLALSHANSFLRRKKDTLPIDAFLGCYEKSMSDVLDSNPEVSRYLLYTYEESQQAIARDVFTTWNLSIQILTDQPKSDLKLALVSILGYFSNTHISEELFQCYYTAAWGQDDAPTWLSLFANDEGQWSSEAFDGVMLDLRDLSIISTVRRIRDRAGGGFATISIHPLVRDWITLRLTQDERKIYYEAASDILAHTLLKYYWSLDFASNWAFRLEDDKRTAFLGHANVWKRNFSKAHTTAPRRLKYFKESRESCVETVFADFYQDSSLLGLSGPIYEWIWQATGSAKEFEDIKAHAGNSLTGNLIMEGQHTSASKLAREHLGYWETNTTSEGTISNSKYFVILAEGENLSARYSNEVLLRDLLSSHYLPEKSKLLYKAELINALGPLIFKSSGSSQPEIYRLSSEVFDASESLGGKAYRQIHWPLRQWRPICMHHPDPRIRLVIATEFVESMDALYGRSHPFYHISREALADVLYLQNSRDQAVEIYREQVTLLQRAPPRGAHLCYAAARLGQLLQQQRKFVEAIPPLRQSIIASFQQAECAVWRRVIPGMRLVEGFLELGDHPQAELSLIFLETLHPQLPPALWDQCVTHFHLYKTAAYGWHKIWASRKDAGGPHLWRRIECLERLWGLFVLVHPGLENQSLAALRDDSRRWVMPSEPSSLYSCRIRGMLAFEPLLKMAQCLVLSNKKSSGLELERDLSEALEQRLDLEEGDAKDVLKHFAKFWSWAAWSGVDDGRISDAVQFLRAQVKRLLPDNEDSRSWFIRELMSLRLQSHLRGDDPWLAEFLENRQNGRDTGISALEKKTKSRRSRFVTFLTTWRRG